MRLLPSHFHGLPTCVVSGEPSQHGLRQSGNYPCFHARSETSQGELNEVSKREIAPDRNASCQPPSNWLGARRFAPRPTPTCTMALRAMWLDVARGAVCIDAAWAEAHTPGSKSGAKGESTRFTPTGQDPTRAPKQTSETRARQTRGHVSRPTATHEHVLRVASCRVPSCCEARAFLDCLTSGSKLGCC